MKIFDQAKACLLLASVMAIAACASSPEPEKQVEQLAGGDQALICTREKILGSNMSKKVCRTKRQIELEREEMLRVNDRDQALQPQTGESQ